MRRGVALGVFVVAIAALVGCSAWLFAVDRSAAVPDNDFFVASAAGALADAIGGASILARHPRHRIGWILTVSAAVDAIGTLVGEYGPYALTIGRPAPLGVVALWLDSWLWVSAVGLLLLTFSYLPDGRLLSPRWRPLPFALAAGTVLVSLAIALAPGPIGGSHSGPGWHDVDNGLAVSDALATVFVFGGGITFLGSAVAAAISLVLRWRRARALPRQQLKWLPGAAATSIAADLLGIAIGAAVGSVAINSAGETVGSVLAPVAIAFAILRYRLYDIDVLINRTIVYAALSAALAAVYAGAVIAMQTLLGPFTRGNEIAVAVSTLLVVALFHPLRRRIQGAVDRRFYRAKYDAERTLDAFASRLRDEVDLGALVRDLAEVAGEAVQPDHVGVWLRRGATTAARSARAGR